MFYVSLELRQGLGRDLESLPNQVIHRSSRELARAVRQPWVTAEDYG